MRILWRVMAGLSLAVAAYAIALLLVPALRPDFVQTSPVPLVVLAHFAGGGIALALGPFQFSASQRARRPVRHRWMGRVYVSAILVGGTAGLVLSGLSQGGVVAHTGFALLAVCWLLSTTAAFMAIRRGDTLIHQQWMTRSFALTLAAVTLRLYLPLSLAAGAPFEVAYPVIAWACWVPNLAVAEWVFVPRARARESASAVA
jgi:uncharacterized membrane protein